MVKILYFILDGWPTFRPDVNVLWGSYLPRHGVRSDISTVARSDSGAESIWGGGNAFLYKRPKGEVSEKLGAFIHDLRVLLTSFGAEYSAIQVRDHAFICLPALIAARVRGLPFFYWMSFPMADSIAQLAERVNPLRNFKRWIYLWIRGNIGKLLLRFIILPRCDHIFVQSERMKADLVRQGLVPANITPVPMAIDPDRFPSALPVVVYNEIISTRRIVGYLGECSRSRRIDFLFECISVARRKIPNILLILVGDAIDDGDKRWLRSRVEELDLSAHVVITGWLPSEVATSHFHSIEVALALMAPDPLLDSTTPTKLVEYLAMGRPVVANDHPDHSFVIRHSRAGLCVPFDSVAYGEAIVQLLENDAHRVEMGRLGREWVLSNRNYANLAETVARVYEDLVV